MRYWCGTKRDVGVGKKLQWNLDIVDILGGTFLYTILSFSTIQVQSIKQSMKSVTEKSTLYRVFPLLAYPLYRGSTVRVNMYIIAF